MASSALLSSCAERFARQEQQEKQQKSALKTQANAAISARLDEMEAKIADMNDKLNATQAALNGFLAAHQPAGSGVPDQAANTIGMDVNPGSPAGDIQAGFVNDSAIQLYRKGEILLQSQKYGEAIQAFSSFLNQYPDHPLAGSAQFHIGQAYFLQKKYSRADHELQKVLTSYDRSVHVSDTLKLMVQAEEALGKTGEAARHRQQLTSIFPNSPAAAQLNSAPSKTAAPFKPDPGYDAPPPTTPVTAPMNDTAPSKVNSGSE